MREDPMPQQRWYGSFLLNGEADGDNCGAEPAIYPDAETRAKTAHAQVDSSGRCSLSDPPMNEISHRPMIKQLCRRRSVHSYWGRLEPGLLLFAAPS